MRSTYHHTRRSLGAILARTTAVLVLGCLTLSSAALANSPRRALNARASGAQTLVITGAGDGHGVGMSQEGALGFAEHGYSYQSILTHYYTGTTLGQAPSGTLVRVLLVGNRSRASFSGANMASGHALNPSVTYTATVSSHTVTISGGGSSISASRLSVTGPGALTLQGTAENGVTNGTYKGAFSISSAVHGGLNVINVLGLEEYVQGTIAGEMPSSWPAAALQAQAVASRTYAITAKAGPSGEFDVYSDTRSQLYKGASAETSRTNAAAAATSGQIVTYQGAPAITFFFASSGGKTEDVQDAFSGATPEPWLRGVSDPFDGGPEHSWTVSMSFQNVTSRLRGLLKGSFQGIEVLKRGYSPRILSAYVLGSGGRTQVRGEELAARLGLEDTWAYFSVRSASGLKAEPDLSGSAPAQTETLPVQSSTPTGSSEPVATGQGGTAAE